MAAKLGPRFALRLRIQPQYQTDPTESVCVFETAQSELFEIEIHSQSFRMELLQNSEERLVFLAQVLKEDEETLFGFATPAERRLFVHLKELPSIGPKKAAALLGAVGVQGLLSLMMGESPKSFKVPGFGPKTMAQVAQGLQNNKKRFLPLLEEVPVGEEKEGSSTKGAGEPSTTPTQKTVSKTHLSPALLKGVERLGLSTDEAFFIYQKLREREENLEGLDHGTLLAKMLQTWGQLRSQSGGA